MRRQERTPPDVALAELAGRQWGVVSLAQLRALGLGARAAQQRVQAGPLRRVHRGVYAVGGAVLPREGRWLAAVLACGPGAVLSHVSAAVHWNLLQLRRAAPGGHRPRVSAQASRGSACTVLVPSMPRTPPTTKASQPRRCTARCSTSPPTPQTTTSSERSRRPSASSSTTTHAIQDVDRPSQRPPRHQAPGRRSPTTRSGRAASWSAACASSPATHGLPQPRATTPSTPPTTPAWRPTSTSRRTTSSSNRRLGHPQDTTSLRR